MAPAEGGLRLRATAGAVAADAPARYFERLSEEFQAAAEVELHEREIGIAGRRVRLRFADSGSLEAFYPALSHLEATLIGDPDIEFRIWDAAATGRPPPGIAWGDQEPTEDAMVLHLSDETVRTKLDPRSSGILCYDRSRAHLLYCTRDVANVPWEVRSSPLIAAFSWALATRSNPIIHAGCVGLEGWGALIAGRSGAGKSTTCIGAAVAGLEYVSDDYLLVETGARPVGHSLTCMGRVHRSDMGRIDGVDRAVAGWVAAEDPKAAVDVRALAPDRVRASLPLKALVLPRLGTGGETVMRRVTAAEALRNMAPSSLFFLPADDPREAFAAMANLARTLPAYVLHLNDDASAAAAALSRLIDDG